MNPRSARDRKPSAPLIAHVIFRLDIGGLENGLVNLINHTPPGLYRHAIICVTQATDFRHRIEGHDVTIVELHKKPGKDFAVFWRFWRSIRKLKPDVIHTRNLNTIEFQPFAFLAGVPGRIHGEHGWDLHDLHGRSRKFRLLRKLVAPFVDSFITVSSDLQRYLTHVVGIDDSKVQVIRNGVDCTRFAKPPNTRRPRLPESGFACSDIVVGTVGRMEAVKNQLLLVRAFSRAIEQRPRLRETIRLVLVGDGDLAPMLRSEIERLNLVDCVWMPGQSNEVNRILQMIDIFVLPSLNEGISNTLLEAMASGCAVIATKVGGTPEIVTDGETGTLVECSDVAGMAEGILRYVENDSYRILHANAARSYIEEHHCLKTMLRRCCNVYADVLGPRQA